MKTCETCEYQELKHNEEPCVECNGFNDKWIAKELKMSCKGCKHIPVASEDEPCKSCLSYPNWEEEVTSPVEEEKIEKTCSNCKFGEVDGLEEPCSDCYGSSNWRSENYMRFQDAQVGDKVYSRVHGEGKITDINNNVEFGLYINFGSARICYSTEGRWTINTEALLYYTDGKNKYLIERPEPTLDWSKVPVDTKVRYNFNRNNSHVHRGYYDRIGFVFAEGRTSWTSHNVIAIPQNCDLIELAEEITLDGKTYPVGTRWTAPK